jgi:hypothetical protein
MVIRSIYYIASTFFPTPLWQMEMQRPQTTHTNNQFSLFFLRFTHSRDGTRPFRIEINPFNGLFGERWTSPAHG